MIGKKRVICFFVIFLLVNIFGFSKNKESQDEKIEKSENYIVLENGNDKDLKNNNDNRNNEEQESGLRKDVDLKNNKNLKNNLKNEESDINKKNVVNQEDKKIGLVLSGGTAKGLAHIGILKVLDEEKVPIEYVTGTSMGSIIGGMYSVGYTPEEIEEIAISMDWMSLFSDKIERKDKGAVRNSIEDKNSTVIPIKNFMPKLPSGVVGGKTASQRLNELFYGALRVEDFRKFPRKFAAVATDLESGEGVMIDKGSIATAIRESLSIPSVFAPIRDGKRLYIDGGVVRNLPVQDVKVLGADYTIGVNVGDGFTKRDESKMNLIDVITDTTTIAGRQEVERQIRMLDLYMKPDLEKFESYDFSKVKEIIAAGEAVARANIDKIRKLSNPELYEKLEEKRKEFRRTWKDEYNITGIVIDGNKKYTRTYFDKFFPKKLGTLTRLDMEKIVNNIYQNGDFTTVYYEVKDNDLIINVQEKPSDYLTLSGNINNEDLATVNVGFQGSKLLNNTNVRYSVKGTVANEYGVKGKATAELGKNSKAVIYGEFEYKRDIIENQKYKNGYFSFENRKFKIGTGIGVEVYKNLLFSIGGGYQISDVEKHENNAENVRKPFPYYEAKLNYDTRDSLKFATRGVYFFSNYTLANSKHAKFNSLDAGGEINIPIGEKITITPGIAYLTSYGKDIPETYRPKMGGIRTADNSLEFAGMPSDKIRGGSIFVGSLKAQYNLSKLVYLDTTYSRANISGKSYSFGNDVKESYRFGVGVKALTIPIYFGFAKVPGESWRYLLNFGYSPE
ncbi:patatin [Leptotrichia wadei]|uniref:Patatin n=1 Tax=Leptotrichia wadei TaxID=157687 RepID=A0A7U6LBJ8_9FUSO|nr:patatin-like phospholipase family protein [Leptotrichia wadei]BBM43399.1 patatin [Leptotrichia wadei]